MQPDLRNRLHDLVDQLDDREMPQAAQALERIRQTSLVEVLRDIPGLRLPDHWPPVIRKSNRSPCRANQRRKYSFVSADDHLLTRRQCLGKALSDRAGSARIRDLFIRKQPFAYCTLGYAEVLSAIARQQGVRQISPDRRNTLRRDIQTDWDEMLHVTIDADVIRLAADLAWNLKLRGADSVHLAAASRLNEVLIARSASLVLVTADSEMVSAAGSHRLNVLNPAKAEVS